MGMSPGPFVFVEDMHFMLSALTQSLMMRALRSNVEQDMWSLTQAAERPETPDPMTATFMFKRDFDTAAEEVSQLERTVGS